MKHQSKSGGVSQLLCSEQQLLQNFCICLGYLYVEHLFDNQIKRAANQCARRNMLLSLIHSIPPLPICCCQMYDQFFLRLFPFPRIVVFLYYKYRFFYVHHKELLMYKILKLLFFSFCASVQSFHQNIKSWISIKAVVNLWSHLSYLFHRFLH